MKLKYLVALILIITFVDIAAASSVSIITTQDYMEQHYGVNLTSV